jgi:hypothetical protein
MGLYHFLARKVQEFFERENKKSAKVKLENPHEDSHGVFSLFGC